MKTCIKNQFLLVMLPAGLGLIMAGRVTAQTFTTLHSFTDTDGFFPQAGLILSGNTLYGTALQGSSSGNGTVFAVNTDGTGFTTLHSFTGTYGPYFGPYTNSDGAGPAAGLILTNNTLYGTTWRGGSWGNGTVFAVDTDGTGFTNLHSFTGGRDGAGPQAGLILSGNTLYGTTVSGGGSGVFAINTDGTGFSTLNSFTNSDNNTNRDGISPQAGLILSGGTLYGTAAYGGSFGNGSVFAVNGTGFTNLYSFTGGSDGFDPQAGMALSGNTLYGTAKYGGTERNGTVFAVNTDGTRFTTLHTFTAQSGSGVTTNSDGISPQAGLILSGNTLYGTATFGGSPGEGTVFAVHTDGAGFIVLHSFHAFSNGTNSDGAFPWAGLILSGNTLYGTAVNGGSSDNGTVFSIRLPGPQLAIIPSATNLILTWPTTYAGFDYTGYTLQSTTNLGSSVWTTNSMPPVLINGQNTVTNPISGTQQFFRLSQ